MSGESLSMSDSNYVVRDSIVMPMVASHLQANAQAITKWLRPVRTAINFKMANILFTIVLIGLTYHAYITLTYSPFIWTGIFY